MKHLVLFLTILFLAGLACTANEPTSEPEIPDSVLVRMIVLEDTTPKTFSLQSKYVPATLSKGMVILVRCYDDVCVFESNKAVYVEKKYLRFYEWYVPYDQEVYILKGDCYV